MFPKLSEAVKKVAKVAKTCPNHDSSAIVIIIIIIIIFIYLPSDVISQKKLQLPLGQSPKHRNTQFL